MDTVRRFRHPLTGDVHEQRVSGGEGKKGSAYTPFVGVAALLLVALFLVGLYAFRCWTGWSKATAAIKAAHGVIEYEPLATVKDGGEEDYGGDAGRRQIRVLRRLLRR